MLDYIYLIRSTAIFCQITEVFFSIRALEDLGNLQQIGTMRTECVIQFKIKKFQTRGEGTKSGEIQVLQVIIIKSSATRN